MTSKPQTSGALVGPGFTVSVLGQAGEGAWDSFVRSQEQANLYHTLVWRDFIGQVFGHRPLYLVCERQGELCGVMPLFLVRAPLLGRKVISIPYEIGSGGPLAVDRESERAIASKAIELARADNALYLEMRCSSDRPGLEDLGFQKSRPVILTEMELDSSAEVSSRVREDHRHSVRKASKRGVVVRTAETLADYMEFYEVYSRAFRAFGTPPYSPKYFRLLQESLKPTGAAHLLLAHVQGKCVGGLLLFCWGVNTVSKFSVCLPEATSLRVSAALYWEAIQYAIGRGYKRLSWGTASARQTGLIGFKEGWGAESHPAVFYGMGIRGDIPQMEKYYNSKGLPQRVWKHLPVGLTQALGHTVNRWFC